MRLFQKSILFILLGLCSDLFSAHLTDCPFTLKLLVPSTALVEGASITLTVVVKNKFARPVYCIVPRTDAAAQKLFPINFYHRDSVLNLLRVTEYAMVDRPDDLKIGIRSSAITFGVLS